MKKKHTTNNFSYLKKWTLLFIVIQMQIIALFAWPQRTVIDAESHAVIEAISPYISQGGSVVDLELKKLGFEPPIPDSEWARLPVPRRLAIAFTAAENAEEGGGQKFLALLSKALAQWYESIAWHSKTYRYVIGQYEGPVVFQNPPKVVYEGSIHPEIRGVLTVIADIVEGGSPRSVYRILLKHMALSEQKVERILIESISSKDALSRGLNEHPPERHRDILKGIVADLGENWEIIRLYPNTKPYWSDYVREEYGKSLSVLGEKWGGLAEPGTPLRDALDRLGAGLFQHLAKQPHQWEELQQIVLWESRVTGLLEKNHLEIYLGLSEIENEVMGSTYLKHHFQEKADSLSMIERQGFWGSLRDSSLARIAEITLPTNENRQVYQDVKDACRQWYEFVDEHALRVALAGRSLTSDEWDRLFLNFTRKNPMMAAIWGFEVINAPGVDIRALEGYAQQSVLEFEALPKSEQKRHLREILGKEGVGVFIPDSAIDHYKGAIGEKIIPQYGYLYFTKELLGRDSEKKARVYFESLEVGKNVGIICNLGK